MASSISPLRERRERRLQATTVTSSTGWSTFVPRAVQLLKQVIAPSSAGNLWTGAHARERNALIVHWLLFLSLRRRELLGARIADINFPRHHVG